MQEAEKLQAPKEIKERLIKEIRRFKSLAITIQRAACREVILRHC